MHSATLSQAVIDSWPGSATVTAERSGTAIGDDANGQVRDWTDLYRLARMNVTWIDVGGEPTGQVEEAEHELSWSPGAEEELLAKEQMLAEYWDDEELDIYNESQ